MVCVGITPRTTTTRVVSSYIVGRVLNGARSYFYQSGGKMPKFSILECIVLPHPRVKGGSLLIRQSDKTPEWWKELIPNMDELLKLVEAINEDVATDLCGYALSLDSDGIMDSLQRAWAVMPEAYTKPEHEQYPHVRRLLALLHT